MSVFVFIDAENTANKYAERVISFIARQNPDQTIQHKVYLDITKPEQMNWHSTCKKHLLGIVNCHSDIKSAVDHSIYVDCITAVYDCYDTPKVYIISSDADFIVLSTYLVNKGISVTGIGSKKSTSLWVESCTEFYYLDELQLQNDFDQQLGHAFRRCLVDSDSSDRVLLSHLGQCISISSEYPAKNLSTAIEKYSETYSIVSDLNGVARYVRAI